MGFDSEAGTTARRSEVVFPVTATPSQGLSLHTPQPGGSRRGQPQVLQNRSPPPASFSDGSPLKPASTPDAGEHIHRECPAHQPRESPLAASSPSSAPASPRPGAPCSPPRLPLGGARGERGEPLREAVGEFAPHGAADGNRGKGEGAHTGRSLCRRALIGLGFPCPGSPGTPRLAPGADLSPPRPQGQARRNASRSASRVGQGRISTRARAAAVAVASRSSSGTWRSAELNQLAKLPREKRLGPL